MGYFTSVIARPQAVKRVNLSKIFGLKIPSITYDPSRVDWASVISGCKASCRYEKRLCNFYIRASAHDALSVRDRVGGADGSLLLTEDELRRPENRHDHFAYIVSKNIIALSKRYRSSVADTLAVCAAVAVEFLGGPRIIEYNKVQPFLVGRLDSSSPNPANALAKADINITQFAEFGYTRGLTMEEMTSLMGTHSLIDSKGCLNVDGKSYCDPLTENCDNISMYTWSNSYYKDVCDIQTEIYDQPKEIEIEINHDFELKTALCKYTSKEFRKETQEDFEEVPETTDLINVVVEIIENGKNNIMRLWNYTTNDAWLGKACRGEHDNSNYQKEIGVSMNKFKNEYSVWSSVYIRAYKKMVSLGAKWSNFGGYPIIGYECPSGYISSEHRVRCHQCSITFRQLNTMGFMFNCHPSCRCSTAFKDTDVYSEWNQ